MAPLPVLTILRGFADRLLNVSVDGGLCVCVCVQHRNGLKDGWTLQHLWFTFWHQLYCVLSLPFCRWRVCVFCQTFHPDMSTGIVATFLFIHCTKVNRILQQRLES